MINCGLEKPNFKDLGEALVDVLLMIIAPEAVVIKEGKGLTYLYQKISKTGKHLKFGITKNHLPDIQQKK